MDEKYIENIDNLAANVEDLIAYLEEAEDRKNQDIGSDVDLASFDSVQTEFSEFNKLLNGIKEVNINTNQTLSAYLQKIDDIEVKKEGGEEDIEEIDTNTNGFDIELETFNTNLTELLDNFESVKNILQDIGIEYDLNINEESINELKEKLNSELVLDLNIENDGELDNLKQTVEDITEKLNTLSINDNMDLSTWIEDLNLIKENLESISNLELDNINFDIFADDNIDDVLSKIESIKNIETDIDISADLENIDLLLNKIKDIDVEELKTIDLEVNIKDVEELESIDLEVNVKDIDIDQIKSDIDTTLEELNNISYVDLDIKLKDNIGERLTEIQTELDNFVSELPPLVIASDISFKTEADQILEDIENQIDDVDITIKPNIDLSDQIEQLENNPLELDIQPNIEIDTSQIEKVMANIPNIDSKNIESLEKQDLIIQALQNNNEILQQMTDNISGLVSPADPVGTVTGESGIDLENKDTSIATVNPSEPDAGLSEEGKIMKQLLEGMKALVSINEGMRMEMLKSNFNSKLDI